MTSKRDIFVKTIATRRSVYSQDRLEQILSESIQAKEKNQEIEQRKIIVESNVLILSMFKANNV